MENIKELIFEEFSEAGYSEIEKTERLPIWANESKSDFWMVFDDLNLDEDEQKDLYDEYRHITEAYQAAEKNRVTCKSVWLCINSCEPKKKELSVNNTSQLCSKLLNFSIKRFCCSIS